MSPWADVVTATHVIWGKLINDNSRVNADESQQLIRVYGAKGSRIIMQHNWLIAATAVHAHRWTWRVNPRGITDN